METNAQGGINIANYLEADEILLLVVPMNEQDIAAITTGKPHTIDFARSEFIALKPATKQLRVIPLTGKSLILDEGATDGFLLLTGSSKVTVALVDAEKPTCGSQMADEINYVARPVDSAALWAEYLALGTDPWARREAVIARFTDGTAIRGISAPDLEALLALYRRWTDDGAADSEMRCACGCLISSQGLGGDQVALDAFNFLMLHGASYQTDTQTVDAWISSPNRR